mgnify:CR=1 FL=1
MGDWNDFTSDSEGFSEELDTLNLDVVVIMVPVVDELNEISGFQGSQKHPDVEIWDSGISMLLECGILLDDDNTFTEEIFVNSSLVLL